MMGSKIVGERTSFSGVAGESDRAVPSTATTIVSPLCPRPVR
jgi:hypothetical protein